VIKYHQQIIKVIERHLLISKQADVQTPSALRVSALSARERPLTGTDYLTDPIYIYIYTCLNSCTQS